MIIKINIKIKRDISNLNECLYIFLFKYEGGQLGKEKIKIK